MPIRPLIITSLFVAGAVMASIPAATAAPRHHQPAAQMDQAPEVSAKKKAKRSRGNAAYGRGSQIACNPAGCFPVPGYCTITAAKTWGGTPTGFDAVICPRH